MREFIIGPNDAGQRLDKFITKAVPKLPKNLMYKYIRLKRIKLNGKRCQISDRLSVEDRVELYLNDEFFEDTGQPGFLSAPGKVDVVYEDGDILLCDKPCGLVVHEDESGTEDTLINRVLKYLYEKGEYDPERELSFVPALCNRLDRNTGGIVICAKNAEALRVMNQKVKDRELDKRYLCVTVGIPPKDRDRLEAFHIKDEREKLARVFDRRVPGSREMITEYRVLKKDLERGLALVEVHLITGRTHQIRAHMAHIGCPLLGDGKYGDNRVNREFGVKTQALHAYSLEFRFTTDSGPLEGLNGRRFISRRVWFAQKLFGYEIPENE